MLSWKQYQYKCTECGTPMISRLIDHDYTESGLKDVKILNVVEDYCPQCGNAEVTIRNPEHLHLIIASELIKRYPLKPEEFRFLKSFLNFETLEVPFKLGLDYHHVISENPKVFSNLSKIFVDSGQEIHVITGRRITDEFKKTLANLDIHYTHLFSIADHHFKLNSPMTGYEEGQPKLIDELWNPTKAIYCEHEKINLHIDDSEVYVDFFKTPYLTYYNDDERTILRYLKKKGIRNGKG